MAKDLTNSRESRQRLLNDVEVIRAFKDYINLNGFIYGETEWFSKEFASSFYQVSLKTIERILKSSEDQTLNNGYVVYTGGSLKELKSAVDSSHQEHPLFILPQARQMGLLTLPALLNIGMLLTESDRAKEIRSLLLNIALDVANIRLGGRAGYVRRADLVSINTAGQETLTLIEFKRSLLQDISWERYSIDDESLFLDKIYKTVFLENYATYKQYLNSNLRKKDRPEMSSEISLVICALQHGFIAELATYRTHNLNKPTNTEALELLNRYLTRVESTMRFFYEKARMILLDSHSNFPEVINSSSSQPSSKMSELEKQLGEKGREIHLLLRQNIAVFERLKVR